MNSISEKDVTILPVGDLGARLSGLQTGRVHGVIIAGIQTLTANKMGFRTLIDYSKLPIEISGSGILVRRSYVDKNPETTLRFLKAWIEGLYLFKTKPDFAIDDSQKIRGEQGSRSPENDLQSVQEEWHITTPTAEVAKSMLYLLSRSSPQVAGVTRKDFIEPATSTNWKVPGFFEEDEPAVRQVSYRA